MKRYEESFKKETVSYILSSRKSVASVAYEVGVSKDTLHSWVKKYGQQPEMESVKTFGSPDEENRALQKRLRDLEEENEILKKAMHYFAKSPR